MGLFKKKKSSNKDIPEIPPLPALPPQTIPQLKSSTDLPPVVGDARDVNNQEIIKSAVNSSEKISGDLGAANSPSGNFIPSTIPNQQLPPIPHTPEKGLPEPPASQMPLVNPFFQQDTRQFETQPTRETVKKDAANSVFVRIDKFNSAKKDVGEIERDLKQITDAIEKITDIKTKEDKEINEINKSLEEIKNRISKMEQDVFNRI